MLDDGWGTELTDDEIACGGPSPASMRGGALVGAFDHRERTAERRTYSCIHERLELNMNRGCSIYHEYEQRNARPVMSINSKRKAIQLNSYE